MFATVSAVLHLFQPRSQMGLTQVSQYRAAQIFRWQGFGYPGQCPGPVELEADQVADAWVVGIADLSGPPQRHNRFIAIDDAAGLVRVFAVHAGQ